VPERQEAIAAAVALFHSTWGAGPLVVALHGLGASSAYWDRLAQHLPDHRVVAPDALGFGRSPAPDGSPYTGEDDGTTRLRWAEQLAASQARLELHVLPHVDHHPALRAPATVAAHLAR